MHRRPRHLAGATVTLIATAGCSGGSAEPAAAAEEGGWSSTDDLGTTVELDAVPERVAGLDDVPRPRTRPSWPAGWRRPGR